MNLLAMVAAALVVLLFLYLCVALLRPEWLE